MNREFNMLSGSKKEAIQTKIDQDQFSGVVYVTKLGRSVLSLSAGFADREHQIPNKIDTKFNLGSNNKMFTAVSIAQLAQAGRLHFQDPIGKYLTDYPNPEVRAVTIHQLLTHTGGTGDIFGPQFDVHLVELKEPNDFIRLYGQRGLAFLPGSHFAYSNYGFILLGAIIERVSGQIYYDYIRQHIYKSASMTSSESYWKMEHIPNRAIGYIRSPDQGALQSNFEHLPMRGTPTGGGYSTAEDLAHFATALQSHQLLNAEYTDIVTTGKVDTPDHQKYAYGFRDRTEKDLHWIGHSGGGPGVNTTLRIYPDLGYVIIVLSNLDYPAADNVAEFIQLLGLNDA
ncbi:MAG: serine hydrolase domain-containing protein [Chlamydiales bacterium]